MKRILTAIILIVSASLQAQVMVNDVDITKLEVKFIEVTISHPTAKKTVVSVDYGQPVKLGFKTKDTILNKEGKMMVFNSDMHVLNFLDEHGFVLYNHSQEGLKRKFIVIHIDR